MKEKFQLFFQPFVGVIILIMLQTCFQIKRDWIKFKPFPASSLEIINTVFIKSTILSISLLLGARFLDGPHY
jgi:hypothetical protein